MRSAVGALVIFTTTYWVFLLNWTPWQIFAQLRKPTVILVPKNLELTSYELEFIISVVALAFRVQISQIQHSIKILN